MKIQIAGLAVTIKLYRCEYCGKILCPEEVKNGQLYLSCDREDCRSRNISPRIRVEQVNEEVQVLYYASQLIHYGVENLGGEV
jgi:hypothetical protein